jgi:UDP-N-acetylglucosamine--N-acetylmuramyl-(pentapeptide) pyrophosphoryl-undecaprenol N-acetylglucosamine transferase
MSAKPASMARLQGLHIAFAGGGTGGHVVPGLHLLECMHQAGGQPGDVLWFGAGRAIEQRVLRDVNSLLPGTAFRHEVLELEGAKGGAPGMARLVRRALPAIQRARRALREHSTQLLVGLGGYTTLPAVLAARSMGVPVCLLEINAVRGKATRWLSPLAKLVFHAWPSTMEGLQGERHLHVGPPLASAFMGPLTTPKQRDQAALEHGFEARKPLLLVLGGSQGAAAINRFVRQFKQQFAAAGIGVLHQVGPGNQMQEPDVAGYQAREYLDDVPGALRAASLVLCRGGASTLAEIAARQVPSLVIPYPHHKDRHQERNARLLGEGVRIVPEERLDGAFLQELIDLIGAAGEAKRSAMAEFLGKAMPRDASERICAELAKLIR